MTIDDRMQLTETGLAQHMVGGDAMDVDIEAAERVARIDHRFIFEADRAVAEPDDADLADAADAGTGGLDIDHDEIGRLPMDRGDRGGWARQHPI